MSDIQLTQEEQKKVLESLEKRNATQQSVNENLYRHNQDVQNKWGEQTYGTHREEFEREYYPIWGVKDEYKEKLKKIEEVRVQGALESKFENQLQPGERSFWKTRRNEKKKITELRQKHPDKRGVVFDKNTIREMSALNKYGKYHKEYFASRENQRHLYTEYTNKGNVDIIQEKWRENIGIQRAKYGAVFGTFTGALASLKDTIVQQIYGDAQELRMPSREEELNKCLRPFFSMTKKTLFWKSQVGKLGTETKSEKKDGSEYNKRLLRVYTTGSAQEKQELMDELADKLIGFKLNPNMLTNKYMAKNMLQMQRYTDMLNAFVEMTKCNPEYLDVTNENAAHTSPQMAALIRSRIILMAPIMTEFMTKHGKYFGYKKNTGIEDDAKIDATETEFETRDQYDAFVARTWEMIKGAYNSTSNFLDDFCDVKIGSGLKDVEKKAKEEREKRKQAGNDDSEFVVKYDVTGEKAKKLVDLKKKIASNPYIYEILGGDLDKIFRKYDQMIRRQDEVEARLNEITKIRDQDVQFKKVENFNEMWKTYVEKEIARITAEQDIINTQLPKYEEAVEYLTSQKIDAKNLKFTVPSDNVKDVLNYEGLNHVFKLQEIFEYNDIFYKTLDYYDFDKFTEVEDPNTQKKIKIKDMQAQYNFTVLKRGMERARMVNRLADGKTTVNIHDVTQLNNIEKRELCGRKFKRTEMEIEQLQDALKAEEKRRADAQKAGQPIEGDILDTEVTVYYVKPKEGKAPKKGTYKKCKLGDIAKYRYTAKEVLAADIEILTSKFDITKELDITSDEAYEKYFQMKSIADMADELEKDPEGKKIPGFREMTQGQQEELEIRASLFKDYFKRWEGQMKYTRTESYAYLADVANMQGNNAVIEGLKKMYRKTTMTEMQDKLLKRYKEEKDQDTKAKLADLTNFMDGMISENDYQAKEIKIFGKDAYEAYKSEYIAAKRRKDLTKLFENDLNKLEGYDPKYVMFGEKREKYIANKVDEAISLQTGIEKYLSDQERVFKGYGMPLSNSVTYEKYNIFDLQLKRSEDEKKRKAASDLTYDKNKDYSLTKNEKKSLIQGYYQRFRETVKKFDSEDYLDDKYLIENISSVLMDLKNATDFVDFIKANNGENFELLAEATGMGEAEAGDLGRYEEMVRALNGCVWSILYEHGITGLNKFGNYQDRAHAKRKLVAQQSKYAKDFADAAKDLKKTLDKARKSSAEDKKILEELDKISKLYHEEEERLQKADESDPTVQRKMDEAKKSGKMIIVKRDNKYEKMYRDLLAQKSKIWDNTVAEFSEISYLMNGVYDSKVEKEELQGKERVDYLDSYGQRSKEKFRELSKVPPKTQARNYVDELFNYIYKIIGDKDFLDPKMVTKALEDAKDAFFWHLSAGARREARMRYDQYKTNPTAMNDYVIWKNTRQTREIMEEHSKVFGQDKFIGKNIDQIYKITNAIGEANDSVNDIQTPEFLDVLANDLELKGIDERQFMFLLRKHGRGFSGLANTVKDAKHAVDNKIDVANYLKVSTKPDFLIKTAQDVLQAGKELKLENINEQYIIDHFEECYFQANKLMAFQQLYYSEYETFKTLGWFDKDYETIEQVKRYFDKGHGEPYALYYNAVMSVARKYGVSKEGALSFGLSMDKVQDIYKNGKTDKETSDVIKDNLKKAEKDTEAAFDAIKKAYTQNKISLDMQEVMDHTLAGVEVQEDKRTRYGISQINTEKKDFTPELEEFYAEHTAAYNGAQRFYDNFKAYEENKNIVTYTRTDQFHPQLLFVTENDTSFKKAKDKINFKHVATAHKNFFNRDKADVGENLSVISQEKAGQAWSLVDQLDLNKGKFAMRDGKFAYGEEWLDKNFSKEFFEAVVNAQNFCMMFEMDNDFMQLESYEDLVMQRKDEGKDTFYGLYMDRKAVIDKLETQEQSLEQESMLYSDQADRIDERIELLQKGRVSPDVEEKIKSLQAERTNLKAKSDELMWGEKMKEIVEEKKELTKQAEDYLKKSGYSEYGKISEDKLKILKGVKKMFSDKKTRFMVSTYFNYVTAYLLKKGIKIDASYTNSEVYDTLLDERSKEGFSSQADALEDGAKTTKELNARYSKMHEERLKFIESGEYEKEYNALVAREKGIQDKMEAERKALEKQKEQLLKTCTSIYDKAAKSMAKQGVTGDRLTDESFAKIKLTFEQCEFLIRLDTDLVDNKEQRELLETLKPFATISFSEEQMRRATAQMEEQTKQMMAQRAKEEKAKTSKKK